MNEKIYLDLDGTLIDTPSVWCNKLNLKYNTNYLPKDILHYNFFQDKHGKECEIWREKDFYDDVSPYLKAQWFVGCLETMFLKKNVFIITWSDSDVIEKAKNNILQYHFHIPKKRIIHSGEKYKHTQDGILVDDHAKHIIEHVTYNNNLGFLFNLNNSFGWNTLEEKHPLIKEVSSYGEILDQLELLI